MKATTSDVVRLLEEDPDLAGLLTGSRRAEAERELVVRVHKLGVGVWDVSRLEGAGADHVGLLVTIGAAVLAVIAGSEYNVVERANLPRLPIGEETLTTGGAIATVAILIGTLMFAALGGIAGARYHRKVDRAGFVD